MSAQSKRKNASNANANGVITRASALLAVEHSPEEPPKCLPKSSTESKVECTSS